jgi:O-antigen/teichoic acid export membrane protein
LVIGFSGGQLLVSAASAVWLFTRTMPDLRPTLHFSKARYQRVFHVGAAFFVSQLAALMLFQSGSIIISRYLGPGQVTPYQVTWMLFFYATLPQQLVSANIWAAVGEAFAKNDIGWIRTLLKRYMRMSMIMGVPLLLFLAAFYETIIGYWAGPAAIPTPELVYWMAAWSLTTLLMTPIIAILVGTCQLQRYSLYNLWTAGAAILGSLLLVPAYGSVGVAMAVVMSSPISIVRAIFLLKRVLQ